MRRYLLLLLLFTFAGSLRAQQSTAPIRPDDLPVTFNGLWRYQAGDDSAWASPAWNDSSWAQRVSLYRPGVDSGAALPHSKVGWFRLRITIDSQLARQAMALTLVHTTRAELFIDGRQIDAPAATRSNYLEKPGMPYNPPFVFTFGTSGKHLLAVRITDTGRMGRNLSGFAATLNTAPEALRAYDMKSTIVTTATVFFFTFFLAFAIMHLILFLYNRKVRSNLYFSLFCLATGGLFFAIYSAMSLENKAIYSWMNDYGFLVIVGSCASLSALLNELFGSGWLRFRIAQAMLLSGLLGIFLEFAQDYLIPILLVAVIIESIVLILRGIARDMPGARIIGAGVLFFALTIFGMISLAMMGPEFAFGISGAPSTIITFGVMLAILSIPLSMSVYLAWNFAAINRTLSRQLTELERLSAAALEHEAEKQRLLESRADELEQQVDIRTEELRGQKEKSDELLRNILPAEVAEELKEKGSAAARHFDNVSVLFTDFADFTQMSEQLSPAGLVDELNQCFSAFDGIITRHGLEKIKTVGDAYIAVSGLPAPNPRHAQDVLAAALEVREFMLDRKKAHPATFGIRLGVHSGSLVAGIVGVKKFAYDIWGDTVNTAARMEQHSEPGQINISAATFALVKEEFDCSFRGELEAKHKGKMGMYFVNSPIRSGISQLAN